MPGYTYRLVWLIHFDSFEQWFNAVCEHHNITHRKVHRFGLGFNGIAKMLRFLLVVINSDYSIEVLLSSSVDDCPCFSTFINMIPIYKLHIFLLLEQL